MRPRSTVELMLRAAVAASRCRQAALATTPGDTRDALLRAADRYSARMAELAADLAAEPSASSGGPC